MYQLLKISFAICLLLLTGCQSSGTRSLSSYKETPVFIRHYLDSVSGGKFLIAEKGEAWQGGCVHSGTIPCRQFQSAFVNDHEYRLVFLEGGMAGTSQSVLSVYFKGERIESESETSAR